MTFDVVRAASIKRHRGFASTLQPRPHFLQVWLRLAVGLCLCAAAEVAIARTPSAERGYELLTTKPYLPADFDQETFDNLWQLWPAMEREAARRSSPAERRKLTFGEYGLMEDAAHPGTGTAQGYLDDGRGGWVMNCLACHGGKLLGHSLPGLPNSLYAMQTLTEDVRTWKLRQGKRLGHLELGMLRTPLSTTIGSTNAVAFGVALESLRTPEMDVRLDRPQFRIVNHDLDAPPFWNVRKKPVLYYDGATPKGHRHLMQFVLLPRNSRATLLAWEDDYRDILAWIESVPVPKYPWPIDASLARAGQTVFERTCARCHGTYGPTPTYPAHVVDLQELGTDPARLQSITPEYRAWYASSWLSQAPDPGVVPPPEAGALSTGYIAPPLDGIWASAPYLHNGSVPTLWHLLHPDERPVVWRRTEEGFSRERVGLEITELPELPAEALAARARRHYFDTRRFGKSAAGHRFPEALSEPEKQQVLEYLKTL